MKTVGYFDGTDSTLLTKLVAKGYGTIPIANDYDAHGKIASHIEPGYVDLIVGYLHKIVPPIRATKEKPEYHIPRGVAEYRGLKPIDLLYPAKTYNIPVFVIVPAEDHKKAKKILGEVAKFVTIISPEDLEEKILETLESE